MRKFLKTAGILTLTAVMIVAVATTVSASSQSSDNENTAVITVLDRNGSPVNSVTVTTQVSGGVACIGQRSFTTDRNGRVTVRWPRNCNVTRVYVRGTRYDIRLQNGGTHTLRLR